MSRNFWISVSIYAAFVAALAVAASRLWGA
jgi:hypothetical protein